MWRGKTVSVAISTYREKDSIRAFIEDCFETGYVDEVVVVNNNAEEGTDEEVKQTQAKLFYEPIQGFGAGYRKALRKTTGDLIIMAEADATFRAEDIENLLVYSDDFPVVFGTRTTSATILEGANMGFFLKWGNWAVSKLVEVFFGTTHLSDVGCTFKCLHRDAYEDIQPHLSILSQELNPEIIVVTALLDIPFVEIPVHYDKRVGESAVTGSFLKSVRLGFIMIWLILKYRVVSLLGNGPKKEGTAKNQARTN